ncbi:MAG: hypothetical protein FJ088_15300, partial [Deltaproteobacteria bacterium]|nr:hypothetical protein [Deltaproteobacteria bacterium]
PSGIKENLKRDVVPYELVKLEQNMVPTYDRQLMEYSYVAVPYTFCGDEYAGNVGCYTWDTGVDILEIVNNCWIMLEHYYLMDAFKRERFSFGKGGNPSSYFSRILTRWLTPMQDAGMYYALYSHLLKDYGWIDQWRYARQYGWALREAAEDGFNFLRRILASPAPGSFKLNGDDNEYYNISYDQGVEGSELNLELGEGKYPYTTFFDEAGMYYYDHPVWIGSFWEKLAAIMTLTDSTVYFTTDFVGEQLAIGVGTSVGFNTIYQKQLSKLLGGVIAGDSSQFADFVKNGKFTQRDFFPEDTYYGEPTVRPSLDSLSLKLYSALYGLAYLPASIDPSFIDSLAVCLKGNGNCYDLSSSSGVEVVEFDDPFGGKTYLAWNTKYEADRYSAAFELVKKG